MQLGLLALSLLNPAPLPADEVTIVATLEAESLTPGAEVGIFLDVHLPEGNTNDERAAPALFLQLDVPASLEPLGRRIETLDALLKNESVREPFERLLTENPTFVPFKVLATPGPHERIGLNVVGYVRPAEGAPYFLRRRVELDLKPGATERPTTAPDSTWTDGEGLLRIGARAPAVVLPTPDGKGTLDLGALIGHRNVLLTTYRAFW